MEPRDDRFEFDIAANISDGRLVFDGIMSNVARKGFMMPAVPKKFDFYSPKWIAVVSTPNKNLRLLVKPRWSKEDGKGKNIGFQIISPPLDWIKFVNELDGREVATSTVFH